MSTFEIIGDTVIVPTVPEGHIELRLANGVLCARQYIFVREPFEPGHLERVASMRIPINALRALESVLGKTAPAPSAPLQDPAQTLTIAQKAQEGQQTFGGLFAQIDKDRG